MGIINLFFHTTRDTNLIHFTPTRRRRSAERYTYTIACSL